MNIGILGSGNVARSLGIGFAELGYGVMLGTSDTAKLSEWLSNNPGIQAGSFREAAEFGGIIVLAVRGDGAVKILSGIDDTYLKGKTIIDTTNPIDTSKPPENGVLSFYTNLGRSLMEELQEKFPGANFVKAFNSVGHAFMFKPQFPEGKPTMFICGNNESAKADVSKILDEFGWEIADMGKVTSARSIEPLCMLWCTPGFLNNQWTHAFKLLKL